MKIDKSKAIASSKSNPCPICQKPHGCKISDDLILCLRGDSSWSIPGWKYLKPLRGFMGGLFGADSGNRQEYEYRPEQQPKAKPTNITPLTDEQLDREARKILKQLALTGKHREELKKRGLTDEIIDLIGFKSVEKYQEFIIPINPNVPGMGNRGTLTNGDSGILIPIRNNKGQIIGFQLASDDRENGKYKWLFGSSDRRVSGELPLQFLKLNDSTDLNINEGTQKPLIAAHLHDINVLGSGGVNWHGSPNEFKEIIDSGLFTRYILNPDAGSKLNHHVMGAYQDLFLFLKKHGITLYVRCWGQGEHSKDEGFDVDEIDTETFNNARIIPYTEWDSEYAKAEEKAREEWVRKRDYAAKLAWVNNKKYTPDITHSEQFCTSPEAPKQGEIVALEYHTGQGKSTKIKSWFANELKDLGAIKLGSRNSLEYQFAASSDFSHLKDDGQMFILDPKGRTTSCIDSILKYDDDDFDGKVLILDEIESVARHLLNGGTLKERQQQVIDKFKIALQRCHSVILADGMLSDYVCNFIQLLSGKKLIKYYNDVIPSRPEVIFYDDIERKSSEKLAHQIKGEAFPWVMFDSQIDCEAMDKDLLKYGRKPLRIDSKTINEPILGKEIKRFLSNPDLFLTGNEQSKTYDCILSTPTVESGLDCNYKGFSGVYLLAKHLEINNLMQMIIRVRDVSVPRHVCAPTYVKSDDNAINSPFIKTLSKILNDLQKASVEALGGELGKHEDEILKAFHRGVEQAYNTPENELFNIFQAIKNYEHSSYRECLIESLKLSGYNVTFAQIGQAIATQFKECKKEVKEQVASDISSSDEIDQQQYKALSKRQDLKWDDRCSVTKYRFKQRLTGIDSVGGLTQDLVFHLLFDNKKLISQAEIRWMLNHPELAVKRSKKAWHGVLRNNRTFLGNFKTLLPLIKELNRLGVPKLMDKLCSIYYNSEYQDIKDLWTKWGRTQVARTSIERGSSPIILINRIAAKLGYESVESGSVWVNGRTRKDYILNDLLCDPYGLIVNQCVSERLENENLDPGIGDNDWLEILQPQSLQSIPSMSPSPYKLTDNIIDINEQVCKASNVDTVSDTAITDVENSQPDPVPEKPESDKLQIGDILFDNQSQPHQLVKVAGTWGWQSHRKDCYISRNDIATGQYHRATVKDVASLIKEAIKNNNINQAIWIDKNYGQGDNSLMEQAMTFDEECCGVYELMDLVG